MHYSDEDSSVFRSVGLSCRNLQRISISTACEGFSAASSSRLFDLPKPNLRHLRVEFDDDSDLSTVFNVLAQKIDSLESFSCGGQGLSVESLKVFLVSQKQLAKIRSELTMRAAARTMAAILERKGTNEAWG